MSLQRSAAPAALLTCPNCSAVVPAQAAACRSCHLPMADVVRHQRSAGARRRAAFASRFWGLVVYAGLAGWCLWQLPSAAAFVVPAAFVAAVLHVGRGRPLLAVLAFVVIAAVAPALLWPAMTTDVVDDLRTSVGG